jgi:hypothetical protein
MRGAAGSELAAVPRDAFALYGVNPVVYCDTMIAAILGQLTGGRAPSRVVNVAHRTPIKICISYALKLPALPGLTLGNAFLT